MRILITDVHCASNRGDCAILHGILLMVGRAFPGAQLKLLTEYPDVARAFFDLPAEQSRMPRFRFSNLKMVLGIGYALVCAGAHRLGIRLPYREKVWRKLALWPLFETDYVISTGGGIYNDFYSQGCIGRLASLMFARILGKPVVMLCQSFGPFNKTTFRTFARFCLNRVNLITTRDRKSLEWLHSIGVRTRVELTADAAFVLTGNLKNAPAALHRLEPLPLPAGDRMRVSISVRTWAYYSRDNAESDYVRTLLEVTRWLIEENGADVYFVSTCTGFGDYHKDDRIMANRLVDQLPPQIRPRARVLCNEYSPAELSAFYGAMTLHIGTRMHSNILAMLAGTPVVALAYEFKTLELMRELGLPKYGIDIENLSPEGIKQRVRDVLANRAQLVATIRQGIERLRDLASVNERLLREVAPFARNEVAIVAGAAHLRNQPDQP